MRKHLLLIASVLTLIGAGCADRFKPREERVSPQKQAIQQAFEQSTSTFAATSTLPAAPTSTVSVPEAPRWDKREIPWRKVSFTPPSGYWVYLADALNTFSLVPGKVPAPESADPIQDVYAKRIAEFQTIEWDSASFPTWDRFEITMAQFACASGDTDETFVSCTDKTINVSRGTVTGSITYTKFTLPSYRKKDGAPMGNHTYIVVRLGASSSYGILVSVLDEKNGVSPSLTLVKSIRVN